jgi:hypothetical protein
MAQANLNHLQTKSNKYYLLCIADHHIRTSPALGLSMALQPKSHNHYIVYYAVGEYIKEGSFYTRVKVVPVLKALGILIKKRIAIKNGIQVY